MCLILSAPCVATTALALVALGSPASAAQAAVGLGTATSYAVLAGAAITNTGPTVISGDVGVSPATRSRASRPAWSTTGSSMRLDAPALQAKDDLTTGYNDAAGRTPVVDKTGEDLGGQTLLPGVYNASTSMFLTGTVTLDGLNNPASVFIFQAGSPYHGQQQHRVAHRRRDAVQRLLAGRQLRHPRHELDVRRHGPGPHLHLRDDGATIQGRLLARNGAVTLDNNTISRPNCPVRTPARHQLAHAEPVPDDHLNRHSVPHRLFWWRRRRLGLRIGRG